MDIPIVAAQKGAFTRSFRQVRVATTVGQIAVSINTGEICFIVGPNGVGKSALSHEIYKNLGQGVAEFFPGHRQIYFSNEQYDFLQQPLSQLENYLFTQGQASNRFRSAWSEDHLKSVIKRLLNDEFHYVSSIANAAKAGQAIPTEAGPLEVLNIIFETARMPISFVLSDGILKAKRENSLPFGIDRLSDGERAALLLIGAVIVRAIGTVLIIDEPEKHLYEGISGPLIAAAVQVRPDLCYVFTTHALSLVDWLSPNHIIHVRNSQVIGTNDERLYEANVMLPSDGINEDLKIAIAGARKKLLFVDGDSSSADISLYSSLFKGWHVVAKGGADTVISNVRTVSHSQDYSWLTSKGIIDRDGRNDHEVQLLAMDSIYALSVPTIENLFCLRDVIWNQADLMHSFAGYLPADQVIASLELEIQSILAAERHDIIFRRAVWLANRKISSTKLSVRNLKEGYRLVESIDIQPFIDESSSEINSIMSLSPFDTLSMLPIKNTPILSKVANHLGFTNVAQYKSSIVRQITLNSKQGIAIRAAMMSRVPIL